MTVDELFLFFDLRLQELHAAVGTVDPSTIRVNRFLRQTFDRGQPNERPVIKHPRKDTNQIDLEEFILQLPDSWKYKH